MPSPKLIHRWSDLFTYDPETGNLVWKELPRSMFKSDRACNARNVRFTGKVAGCEHSNEKGRHAILVNDGGKRVGAHRVIWEMHNGAIPAGMVIDHINGDPWDNRLPNLRLATIAENSRNGRMRKNNTSGFKGVIWSLGKWRAQIKMNRKLISLGGYHTKEQAYAAYCEGAKRYHGEFARTH